ncbi:MAG: hypothetical protein ACRENG_17735, partial [bacterium]
MSKPVVFIIHQDGLLEEKLEKFLGTNYQPLFVNNFAEAYNLATQQNVLCVVTEPYFKGRDYLAGVAHFRRQFETIPVVFYGRLPNLDEPIKTDNCICFHTLDELLQVLPTIIERHT